MMKLKKTALTMLAIGTVAMLFTACGSPKKGETGADGSTKISIWRQGGTPDCRI